MAEPPKAPFHNPFAALAPLRDGQEKIDAPAPAPVAPERPTPAIARAVVRLERSGRGGKDVTIIEHLGLTPARLDEWGRALRSGLGCGGTVEGGVIVLQGDQRTRVTPILSARGVKKVIVA